MIIGEGRVPKNVNFCCQIKRRAGVSNLSQKLSFHNLILIIPISPLTSKHLELLSQRFNQVLTEPYALVPFERLMLMIESEGRNIHMIYGWVTYWQYPAEPSLKRIHLPSSLPRTSTSLGHPPSYSAQLSGKTKLHLEE